MIRMRGRRLSSQDLQGHFKDTSSRQYTKLRRCSMSSDVENYKTFISEISNSQYEDVFYAEDVEDFKTFISEISDNQHVNQEVEDVLYNENEDQQDRQISQGNNETQTGQLDNSTGFPRDKQSIQSNPSGKIDEVVCQPGFNSPGL